MGAQRCPIPAPGPEGTGCMDGSSCQLHQDLGNSSSRGNSSAPYLLFQGPLGKSVTPEELAGGSVMHHQTSFNAVGPFCLDITHGPCWMRNATLGREQTAQATIRVGHMQTSIDDSLSRYFGMVRPLRHPQHSCHCPSLGLALHNRACFPFRACMGKRHAS